MENKDLVIIALIVVIIYLAYQQNQPNLLGNSEEQVKNLQQEVQHYQTLYQKRVEKDVEYPLMLEQKTTDLETSLLNLAKQKLKGKKEAQKLLNNLETNWKKDQEKWAKEKKELQEEMNEEQSIFQGYLRKINLLFDDKAKDYETIDFNGLYSLLSSIAERERERERDETTKSWWGK